MKKLLKILLALVVLLLLVILLSPLWIGPVVCSVANSVVPAKTQTPFHLGSFSLNAYTGNLLVGELKLENPEGCAERQAVDLTSLRVEVDTTSLLTDTIVVRNIELNGLFVAYVYDQTGRSNFDVIMKNVKGEAQPAKTSEQPQVQTPAQPKAETPTAPKSEAKTDKSQRKVIIDRVSLSGVRVKYGPLTLPVPNFTLTGIGRKSNGVVLTEAYREISDKVMASLGGVGDQLKNLGAQLQLPEGSLKAVQSLRQDAGAQMNKALEVTGSATKAAGATANKALDSATEATKAAGETATKALDSATKAVDTFKGLFK